MRVNIIWDSYFGDLIASSTHFNSFTSLPEFCPLTTISFPNTITGDKNDISWSLPGEGDGTPLQCSCLENPRDGGAWWAAVYGVAQSRTRLKQLSSSSSMVTLTQKHFVFLSLRLMPGQETLEEILSSCSESVILDPRHWHY